MLEVLENVEELDLSGLTAHEKGIVDTYKKLKAVGGKVIFRKKTIKSGSFLNIYCYDQTNWKYMLRYSIKIG